MKDCNRCQTKYIKMFIRHQISVPHASSWTKRSRWYIVLVFCCNYRKKWSKVGFLWTISARNDNSNLISLQVICFKGNKKDVEKLPRYLRTFKCRNLLPLSSKGIFQYSKMWAIFFGIRDDRWNRTRADHGLHARANVNLKRLACDWKTRTFSFLIKYLALLS